MKSQAITTVAFAIAVLGGWLLLDDLQAATDRSLTGALLAIAPSAVGAAIWRLEGHRIGAIASWTVPLLVATSVSIYVFDDGPSVVLYVLCVGAMAAMVLTRTAPLVWRSLLKLP